MKLKEEVRSYWEKEPCGTGWHIVKDLPPLTREWFEQIEEHRYTVEPVIHSVAQFTLHHGKKLLEIGVGAGTDHLQWARAGCECHGVDLTDAAIETTRARLSIYGFESNLKRIDAEELPFPAETFDLVYSWGVIHHSQKPERMVNEIRRVLKRRGMFIGMVYGRRSPLVFKLWVKRALMKGKPWRSFADLVWHHMESPGTKAYTIGELEKMFWEFDRLTIRPLITAYDRDNWPVWLSKFFPDKWGWFITLRATK